jgi:hypothetical protein
LVSNPNAACYEQEMSYGSEIKSLLTATEGNALLFNYPGVGASTGLPNKNAMIKVYQAMLNFLEDQEKGIGAKEIIGWGFSIGGGVQGNALRWHKLKEKIKYVFVKDRTFSDLATTADYLVFRCAGIALKLLGWNMRSVESSKKLQAPEIIIQTADVSHPTILKNSVGIVDDGIIAKEASLAKALLDDPLCPRQNKTFFGISQNHCSYIGDITFTFLAGEINKKLADFY